MCMWLTHDPPTHTLPTQRIRELEEEAEEHAANINRLTLREREARSEVAVVRALLARGGDFYPEVLPVKRMGYVDYDEVRACGLID